METRAFLEQTFDLKLDAPSEIRGEFRPISTSVPGIQICEHLPLIARVTDKLAIIRSISDAIDDHSDFMCMTGRRKQNQPQGGWPTFGGGSLRPDAETKSHATRRLTLPTAAKASRSRRTPRSGLHVRFR